MKGKEKQIEEMAKDCYYVAHLLRFNDPCMFSLKGWSELTKEMIKLGWIKPNEDTVVLSREECEKLYYKGYENGKQIAEKFYKPLVKAETNKETAEKAFKITKKIIDKKYAIETPSTRVTLSNIINQIEKEFAKQFGFEIKE